MGGMENQESSVNPEAITADDINMEDIVITSTQQRWQGQSSDIAEKTIGMNKSQITNLALNLLSTNSLVRSTGIHIPEMKPCILCKQKFISHPDEPIKEFTMITCGCLYHQKCLEGYLLNIAKTRAKLSCPNWDCKGREIETLITQDLFKEMDKPTTLTAEDTASKQVYSENATPVSEDANEIYMNQLGLFSEEEQSSSKTTVKASSSIQIIKETSDQATSPIEVVSTTPGNSENLDDSISKALAVKSNVLYVRNAPKKFL